MHDSYVLLCVAERPFCTKDIAPTKIMRRWADRHVEVVHTVRTARIARTVRTVRIVRIARIALLVALTDLQFFQARPRFLFSQDNSNS